jgi:hypothetical protein
MERDGMQESEKDEKPKLDVSTGSRPKKPVDAADAPRMNTLSGFATDALEFDPVRRMYYYLRVRDLEPNTK